MIPHPPAGARILVVEDDDDVARFVVHVLERQGGYTVTRAAEPVAGLALLAAEQWALLVTDLQMPTMNGLEMLRRARATRPGLRAIVMTAYASVDVAVDAVRARADEFLVKPTRPADLLEAVARVLARAEPGARPPRRVLAIGAHPDDVEIGVGGALLAHRARGDDVTVLTLSRGAQGGSQEERAAEAKLAAGLLGATLYLGELTDTAIGEGAATVTVIENVVGLVHPHTVYTHTSHEVHQDHRNTHRAAMVACRRVSRVYCFQSPSTTIDFRPTRFLSIDGHLAGKLAAIRAYASQVSIRDYLDEELITATARYWGHQGGTRYAEPLEIVRDRDSAVDGQRDSGQAPAEAVADVVG